MAKKIEATLFAVLFILMIAVPALNTNLKRNQASDLDNRMLNEVPVGVAAYSRELAGQIGSKKSLSLLEETIKRFTKAVEASLQDRVGFRAQMLSAYQKINEALFGIMAHPLYMWGKDGHLYYAGGEYINGYRNIYDEGRLDRGARYLARMAGFLEERGVGLFFFLIPDKKTVYPEYFPSYIRKTDNPPLIGALLCRLDEAGVEYACPLEAFLALKGGSKLYNRQFDVSHWNADGAIEGISLLLDKISARYPQVPPLNRENFERAMVKVDRLPQSNYRIDEDVPLYTAKDGSAFMNEELSAEAESASGAECAVYDNAGIEDGLTALIFRDSYLGIDNLKSDQYRSFLAASFKRAVFVPTKNLCRLSWYLNVFSPDIVIVEAVERVVDVDGGPFNKGRMAATYFPRASSAEMPLDESVAVSLEEIGIARLPHLATISGKLAIYGGEVTSVYVNVGGKEYPAQVDAAGRFSATLANTALEGADGIALIPANGGFRAESLELRLEL